MVSHSMKVVARKTGLSPHTIRVWERRYQAVSPLRTQTNRRVYAEEDVDRLALMARLTAAGHTISRIARLPLQTLQQMLQELPHPSAPQQAPGDDPLAELRRQGLQAVKDLDGARLRQVLETAAVRLGTHGLIRHYVVPLAHQIGDSWQSGEITVANEHFASAILRTFFDKFARPFATAEHAPSLVVATPAGQLHELGAVLAAATAIDAGWRVTYLGTNLPAVEIAGAALKTHARAVALSIVYPQDDPYMAEDLAALRRHLPAEVSILVGGRAAAAYSDSLRKIEATLLSDFDGLTRALEQLREPSKPSS